MATGLEAGQLAGLAGLAGGAGGEGIGQQRIGVGNIKRVADQRGAERLIEASEKGLLHLGHAIAIGVAHHGHAVCAAAHGGGALHRGVDRIVEGGLDAARSEQRLGGQDIAVWQNGERAGMLEPGGKGIHLETGGGGGQVTGSPAARGGHLEGGDALRAGGRNGGCGAQSRGRVVGAKAAHEDHHGTDHGHQSCCEFCHLRLQFGGTIAKRAAEGNLKAESGCTPTYVCPRSRRP